MKILELFTRQAQEDSPQELQLRGDDEPRRLRSGTYLVVAISPANGREYYLQEDGTSFDGHLMNAMEFDNALDAVKFVRSTFSYPELHIGGDAMAVQVLYVVDAGTGKVSSTTPLPRSATAQEDIQEELEFHTFLNQREPYLIYDPEDITESQIKYYVTEDDDFIAEAKEEFRTENDLEADEEPDVEAFQKYLQERAEKWVYEDSDLYQWAWDDFVKEFDELLTAFVNADDNPDLIDALHVQEQRDRYSDDVSARISAKDIIHKIALDRYDGRWQVWARGDHLEVYCGWHYDIRITHYEENE